MKKTLLVFFVLLTTLSVFFSFPVFAYDPQYANKVVEHYTSGSLYITSSAVQFYPVTYDSEAPSQYFGNATTETFITVRLYNSSTQDCYVGSTNIYLTYGNTAIVPYVCGIDNYGTDLFLSFENTNTALRVTPSNDYSVWTGLVVPPQSSLYLAASVYTQCQDTSVRPDAVALTGIQTLVTGVSLGNYSYSGDPNPVDISGIISELNSIDTNTSDALSILQDIKTALIFNGTIYSPNYNPVQSMVRGITTGVDYYYENYSIYTGQSHIVVDTVEVADNDSSYHVYTRKIPITISIQQENYRDYAVANTGGTDKNALLFYDLLPSSNDISYEIGTTTSDVFQNPRIIYDANSNYVNLIFDYKLGKSASGGFEGLVPVGLNNSTFTIYAYVRGNNTFAFNQNFTSPSQSYYLTDLKIDNDARITISDIRDQLQSSHSADISTDSSTIHDQSSVIHSQEQSYYQQNSQAIQATGLSNYQFDNTTVSGLQGVRGDFVDVWNSLGGWTSVYIFSLTLGLALTILRHSPSAISSAVRRRQYNNQSKDN